MSDKHNFDVFEAAWMLSNLTSCALVAFTSGRIPGGHLDNVSFICDSRKMTFSRVPGFPGNQTLDMPFFWLGKFH